MRTMKQRGRLVRMTAVTAGLITLLAGCAGGGGGANPDGSVTLRLSSYGDTVKLENRAKIFESYNSSNEDGITVDVEGTPSADYWDKLATQFAGSNAADVINLDAARMQQYAEKGALAPLDDYVGSIIDVSTMDPGNVDTGKIDGVQYGIPVNASVWTWGYDATVLDELGIDHPDGTWTWDDYAALADEIWEESGHKIHGSSDPSGELRIFENWLRSHGGALWKDGEFNATKADLTEWFEYWAELRESGGAVTPDVAAQFKYGDWPNNPIATGVAVMTPISSPNIVGGFRLLSDDQIDVVLPPAATPGGKSGSYIQSSSFYAINSKTQNKEAAAKVINWWAGPDEPELKFQVSQVLAAKTAMDAVLASPDLSDNDKYVIEVVMGAMDVVDKAPENPPAADTPVAEQFLKSSQDIAFGRMSISDGVDDLLTQIEQAIKNS